MAGGAKRLSERRLVWRHRFHVLRAWWGAIVFAAGAAALFTIWFGWRVNLAAMPATPERGTIIRIGNAPAGEYGDQPMIVFRTADGAVSQLRIESDALRGCRVGGPVNLLRREGGRWSLAGTPCLFGGRRID